MNRCACNYLCLILRKNLLILLCDLLLSVKINFVITNKLEARPEDFTRLNPSNFGLYTRFAFLKLCSGKEVVVFIAFRFPNRFNSYILPSPHSPIRMHLKFIIIKILSLLLIGKFYYYYLNQLLPPL